MLRKTFGIAGLIGVLSLMPISFHAPEAGRLPQPALSDLSCEETQDCCVEPGSICLANGEAKPDYREAKRGSCD